MKKIADIKTNFPEWYQDVIFQAELVDNSPTRGSMVIRPYGYAIWELMQSILDKKIKSLGAQNAYFPLLIPESFLKQEAEHVEGFAPEVAVVTHAGGKKLEEPLVIRPTSETMIYHMFSKWITSWRDLPLKINQWANVVRWEMRPRAFLRTTEFLWQEGHTAHATKDEANQMALDAQQMYNHFMENQLAMPVFAGVKTESERFAGAEQTYCLEAIMPDGKALQMGTSHLLAHSFPKSFGIQFQDETGALQVPFCSSWGVTTRMIGGVIMAHGDEHGLVFPPAIAPIQVIIVPIFKGDNAKNEIIEQAQQIEHLLTDRGVRVKIDMDDSKRPGAKFFEWELKGVPVRIELGPRDVEQRQCVVVSRIELDGCEKKRVVAANNVTTTATDMLELIRKQLFSNATHMVQTIVQPGEKLKSFGSVIEKEGKVFKTGWCGSLACEAQLKPCKSSIRCLLDTNEAKTCFACEKKSIADVIVARSY